MIRALLILISLSFAAFSQTTVWLRDGGYTATYRVTNGSTGAIGGRFTAQLRDYTGAIHHTLTNGTRIGIQNVLGCYDANGTDRLVANANQSAGTIQLTDLSANPINCTGAFVTTPVSAAEETGRVGPVHQYTIPAHPRMYFPPTGALNTFVNGTASPAPSTTDQQNAWDGMASRFNASLQLFDDPLVCDGKTPALCPNAAAKLANQDVDLYILPALALFWYGDQTAVGSGNYVSATARLNAIKFFINHYEKLASNQYSSFGPLGAYYGAAAVYGKGSQADTSMIGAGNAAVAFSIIRSQLTTAERQAFARKLLNGVGSSVVPASGMCGNSMTDTGFTASATGTALTSTGGLTGFSVGDWVFIPDSSLKNGATTYGWGQIVSITDATHATLAGNLYPTATKLVSGVTTPISGELFKVPMLPSGYNDWSTGLCGMLGEGTMEGAYSPPYAKSQQYATASGAYVAASSSITLNADGSGITLTPPFYVGTPKSEVIQVTHRTGNVLDGLVRGALNSTPNTIANGDLLQFSYYDPDRGGGLLCSCTYNLTINKQRTMIMAGLALIDDDSRAQQLLVDSVNFWHDYVLEEASRTYTSRGPGGITVGYQLGREGSQLPQAGAILEVIGYHDATLPIFDRRAYYPMFWFYPGQDNSIGPGNDGSEFPARLDWLQIMQYYSNGTNEQKYARFWFDTVANYNTVTRWGSSLGSFGAFVRAVFARAADSTIDYRTAIDPWLIDTTTDNTSSNARPLGYISSKKSFGSGSWLLANAGNWSVDHDQQYWQFPTNWGAAYNKIQLLGGDTGPVAMLGGGSSGQMFIVGNTGTVTNVRGIPETTSTNEGGPVSHLDRSIGTVDYVYGRLNHKDLWKSTQHVTRAYRSWLHLKGPSVDYVVVYDDVAGSCSPTCPTTLRTQIGYMKQGDAATTFTGAGSSMTFKKPTQGAMVSTKVLFPGVSGTITDVSVANVYRAMIDWGAVSTAQGIQVHRISAGSSDVMPTTALVTADTNSYGFQVDDSNSSWAVVYSKDGIDRASRSITTTFAGAGQIIFTGLRAGTASYTVTKDGSNIATGRTVNAADGTMLVAVTGAGTYAVSTPSSDPTVTTATLSGGVMGTLYSQTLTATGGTLPYTWSLSSGALPTGLSLAPSTGVISGNPTTAGTYAFTVQVTDASLGTGFANLSITMTAGAVTLSVTTASLTGGTVGTAYSKTLAATGGTTPYSWSLSAGALPDGLSLSSSTGIISGTPLTAATFSFTVRVTDNVAATATKALSIVVAAAPSGLAITTTSITAGTVSTAYSQPLQAGGGTEPYTWAVTVGTLPAGLTLASSGTISGTPTTIGTSNFTVRVTDAAAATDTQALSLTINPLVINISTSSLPGGTISRAYSQTLNSTGGAGGNVWAITAGALPTGLTLNAVSAVISGTPTVLGTFSFTARVTDSSALTDSKDFTIVISDIPVISTTFLPNGFVGIPYDQVNSTPQIEVTGGTPPFAWAITSGALPSGIVLNSDGTLSGTPLQLTTANFGVTATDSSGAPTAEQALSIVVTAPLPVFVNGKGKLNGAIIR